MKRLGKFAKDFKQFENTEASFERLLYNGYWLAPSPELYSVAVVPVMWPHVSEDNASEGLPEKLNTTGAGDMTFGSFFLLGGV